MMQFKKIKVFNKHKSILKKIIKPSEEEVQAYEKFLKFNLKKNFFNLIF